MEKGDGQRKARYFSATHVEHNLARASIAIVPLPSPRPASDPLGPITS